jgi:hypothetical protein
MSDRIIRYYYDALNERRFADAARLFADDSRFSWVPFRETQAGQAGFREFIDRWGSAFPNAQFRIAHVEQPAEWTCDVDLVASGTHIGSLDAGIYQFKPTSHNVAIPMRQRFEFDGRERITYTSVSMNVQELIAQLSALDFARFDEYMAEMTRLHATLAAAKDDPARWQEAVERLGRYLDAARHALRPYYHR